MMLLERYNAFLIDTGSVNLGFFLIFSGPVVRVQSRVAIARHQTVQEPNNIERSLLAALAEPSSEGSIILPIASDPEGYPHTSA